MTFVGFVEKVQYKNKVPENIRRNAVFMSSFDNITSENGRGERSYNITTLIVLSSRI